MKSQIRTTAKLSKSTSDQAKQNSSASASVQRAVAGSSSQQVPSDDTTSGRPPNERILELRLRLCNLLTLVRTSMSFNHTEAVKSIITDKEFKNSSFFLIYLTLSDLFNENHFASFDSKYESLFIASYNPNDQDNFKDSWNVVIEDSIAIYLDVCGQLIDQFDDSTQFECCKTGLSMRKANFEGSRLSFSTQEPNCCASNNLIYGIRCKLCKDNIRYVGQTTETAHKRVCKGHCTTTTNEEMLKHVQVHSSSFRDVMELIILPISDQNDPKKLNRWECFWQFIFRCRTRRGGWVERSPQKVEK